MNDGAQVTATAYVYDGWRCIEAWEATWPVGSPPLSPTYTLAAQYVHGGYIDELLVMRRDVDDNGSLEEYFYHADDQFNIVAVTNASGTVVERYEYGPFGAPTILDPAGAERTESAIGNTHLWNGREYDPETGLYYYRLRYLDPELGRFTTLDPIGLWGDPNNLGNGYAYVGNRPWTGLDPFGLSIRSLYYGEAYGLDSYPSSNTPMPPRLAGFFRAVGGATEMGGGAAVGAGGTATGVGAIPGVAVATVMIAHGADTVQAGINQMIYGEHWQSYTEQLATAATGSEQAGAYIDMGLGFLDLGAGGVSLLTRTPKIAGAADNVLSCTDNAVDSATRTVDTTAGSEFLDDALRMTDQPLVAGWRVPAAATDKIPAGWGVGRPNKKGIGMRWTDPMNKGNGVRIDKGNPASGYATQQVDHVIVNSNGRIIGRDGKPILGRIEANAEAAHIPLAEYVRWRNWNAP